MAIARIRGVSINYEVVGASGPWLALTPGGRRGYSEFLPLADKIARRGFRVLLHDRRNCGLSDLSFDDSKADDTIWAEDLYVLLQKLDALPAFIGGSSSGCRLSLLLYLRHRPDVKGLLLFRVTGGPYAAKALPEKYYERFIRAAREGGMAAVCETDHWQERLARRPSDRDALMAISPERFIAVMSAWKDWFLSGVDLPVLGVNEAELKSIDVPTIVIPGNDRVHSGPVGVLAHSLIPGAELHQLPIEESDRELIPFEEWASHEDEIATTFADFMKRVDISPPRAEASLDPRLQRLSAYG
ncbi:MAG: alpha/beta hydrolase [Beijerinckiaceae bacterium]